MRRFFLALIWLYQRILSVPLRFLGAECRFHPSCSAYAFEAFEVHGTFRALQLTVTRLAKCGPWHSGGFDPVPPIKSR